MSDIHDLVAWVDRLRMLNEQVARTRVDLEILESQPNAENYGHMIENARQNYSDTIEQFQTAAERVKAITVNLETEVN